MKKNLIILLIFAIVIFIIISYNYYEYKASIEKVAKYNKEYEWYLEGEIYGADIATIINKAVNQNEKNGVEKDEQNYFIENNENSIKIDIHILENDTIYNMKRINKKPIEDFVKNFNTIKFKCVKKDYHESTQKIKYILFEQIIEE